MTAATAAAFEGISRLATREVSSCIEELRGILQGLVTERQQLRDAQAPAADLEDNRLAIIECQWALSRALIAESSSRA